MYVISCRFLKKAAQKLCLKRVCAGFIVLLFLKYSFSHVRKALCPTFFRKEESFFFQESG